MIILCRLCDTLQEHKEQIVRESKLKSGNKVEWSNGTIGEGEARECGKVIEVGDPDISNGDGHRRILVEGEYSNGERRWMFAFYTRKCNGK